MTDGGRTEAGYKGKARDCGVRALAVALQIPYKEVYMRVNDLKKTTKIPAKKKQKKGSAREGMHTEVMDAFLEDHGWSWTATMLFGQGCTTHLCKDELPSGRIIVRVTKHFACVVDGVLHDDHDCSRDGRRCVYGYWSKN